MSEWTCLGTIDGIFFPKEGDPVTLPAPNTQSSAAVLSKATVRAAEQLNVRQAQLAKVLGLSAATTSRLAAGTWLLPQESKAWELAAAFVRLYRSLAAITGGKAQAMRDWLHSANEALGGEPAERILTAEGLFHVVQYLDAARGRI
jgi:transcriptional regulator with XRE-family HTH domain